MTPSRPDSTLTAVINDSGLGPPVVSGWAVVVSFPSGTVPLKRVQVPFPNPIISEPMNGHVLFWLVASGRKCPVMKKEEIVNGTLALVTLIDSSCSSSDRRLSEKSGWFGTSTAARDIVVVSGGRSSREYIAVGGSMVSFVAGTIPNTIIDEPKATISPQTNFKINDNHH